MSLQPHLMATIPTDTSRVAHAAFPKGHPYLTFRDALGTIFQDEDFARLYARTGQPGLAPWRLALVTLMQFRENVADRQAAEAVRARIDWKYLLSLELTDPGCDFSVLSEFRERLVAGHAEALLLDKLLERCRTLGLAHGPRPAAHGLDACPGGHPGAQPSRTRGGDPPGGLECRGHGGARLAASAHAAGLV